MWLAIGLAAAGLVAIILEIFVPAAGIIGIAGLGSIVASIVIAYQRLGSLVGSIYLAVVLVMVPVFIVLYFRYFPRSPVGRWLIAQDAFTPEYLAERLNSLLGLPAILNKAAENAKSAGKPEAGKRLADMVFELLPQNGSNGDEERSAA